jgi:drug/metabolite transporter (DMT)-like permease
MEKQKNRTKKETFLIIFCYLTIYIVWGSTYFFIKIAVETVPPFYVVGLRFFLGGILLLLIAFLFRGFRKIPSLKQIISSVFLGTFLLIGGNGFITLAEKKVDSYLAALIISSTPIMVAFFDWLFLKKRISLAGFIGIIFGLLGVSFLVYNGHSIKTSLTPETFMLLAGLSCWAFATSLGHKIKVHDDSLVNSGIQMLWVGIICIIVMSFFKPPLLNIIPHITLRSSLSLWYLAIIGSLAFAAYNYLIQHEPAIRIVSYAFVNPLVAVLLGFLLGNEKPVTFILIGIPLILLGLIFMLYGRIIFSFIKLKIKKKEL